MMAMALGCCMARPGGSPRTGQEGLLQFKGRSTFLGKALSYALANDHVEGGYPRVRIPQGRQAYWVMVCRKGSVIFMTSLTSPRVIMDDLGLRIILSMAGKAAIMALTC